MKVVLGLVCAAVALGAGAATAGTTQDDPWAGLRRPLHLPHIKAGHTCPASRGGGQSGGQTLYGRGPVYLIGLQGTSKATVGIGDSARDALGWYGQKTPWAITRSYTGPILVRGARIGRKGRVHGPKGQMRFAYGYGAHLKELHWESGADQGLPPDPNFRFLASASLFRRTGCYAYQIDGTSFSEIVVARVGD